MSHWPKSHQGLYNLVSTFTFSSPFFCWEDKGTTAYLRSWREWIMMSTRKGSVPLCSERALDMKYRPSSLNNACLMQFSMCSNSYSLFPVWWYWYSSLFKAVDLLLMTWLLIMFYQVVTGRSCPVIFFFLVNYFEMPSVRSEKSPHFLEGTERLN